MGAKRLDGGASQRGSVGNVLIETRQQGLKGQYS